MKSKDVIKMELREKLSAAMDSKNPEQLVEVFADFAMSVQQEMLEDIKLYRESGDQAILARRGVRQLTQQEKDFYTALAKAAAAPDPKMAFDGLNSSTLPTTVIDAVTEDIGMQFPLLDNITLQNVSALTKMIVNEQEAQFAVWGPLNSAITEELSGAIGVINVALKKLTAFIPIDKDMIDVGPEWMDAYARAILAEAIGLGLCKGSIAGTGKNEPIGMLKDLDGAVVNGVYPDKTAEPITDLSPATLGAIAAELSQSPTGRYRNITNILVVVNPKDYFTKVMPTTTYMTPNGAYVNNVLPYPATIIQDTNVPEGLAIFGIGKRYALGVGKGSTKGAVDTSDEFEFLDDKRVYKTKVYADGRPLDNNAFVVKDITGLKPLALRVTLGDDVIKTDLQNTSIDANILNEILNVRGLHDARLASLKIGNLTLSPAFNKSVFNYTCTTENATNTITAVAKDGEAEITITLNGDTEIDNGTAATWSDGENTLTIDVEIGTATKRYTVIVTKSTGS